MVIISATDEQNLNQLLTENISDLKILYFYIENSAECNQMTDVINELDQSGDSKDLTFIKIDAKKFEEISSKKFAVENVPTYLFYVSKEYTFKGHGDSVDQLCWHPSNPDLLATASLDKTVRIWDAKLQKSIATVQTKGENINICWSPNGQTIAVGNKEDLVTFIDVRTHKIINDQQFKFEVNELSWNNDNSYFFLTNGQGCIYILSYPDLQIKHILSAHPANCICIEFDKTGKYFATGSVDALVSLWDVETLVCVRTFSRLEWPVRTISFSHDGCMLASASEDHLVDITDVHTGEKIAEVPCESPTFTVAWHPKRHLLAFACDDKDKHNRDRDAGTVKLFGLSSDS